MQAKVEDQLSELPIKILMHIMTFLNHRDLTLLELVCKDWKELASSDIVWKTATGHTKEELSNPDLYTILTLPEGMGFSFGLIRKGFALLEKELQQVFQHTDNIKKVSFPEAIGNETIETDTGSRAYEYKYKNQVFNSEEDLKRIFDQARKESNEYTCYSRTEFFVRYKEINDEIHIYALKHITVHQEWTTFQAPFVFNRNLVANFPSVKPASANTQGKTANPAHKTADRKSDKVPVATATNHMNPPKMERKTQPLAAASAYQPGYFQPKPKPAPASTTVLNRAPIRLPGASAKSSSNGCTIS